ncbi:hypothetical protein A3D71_03670 [Candidatus Kaiserbacteria bacterium RIFCSPHIGHO2_02_FULL_55_20]|uniref:Uncharacterized protein n=1 Tax=Candidatus Kaiserbacteria bacterium RIFCSPHIGHO2_02_FULL_55_20 TaxID=1798497 RepID=A0A1F6DY01_9BACT|nr:MAG: hypothetical protein A2680_03865 [Candidatus Kaiserbacteria bacterium RIFCSPHIGHO2_01_FULL_55_37]OGG66314.1 MAG: hypothetical protein A3D71_03670 [Candidatus Kaiserbacteria bacterium RIFCSPHIGHO2_02_FULL_55_20]
MVHIIRKTHPNAIPVGITREAWALVISILLSIWLLKTDAMGAFVEHAAAFEEISSFISGIFFTSILTTAPAIVALGELGQHIAPWKVAVFGGAGAVCGDILIFRFLHSPLANYIIRAAFSPRLRHMGAVLAKGALWWTVPLLGAIVIASPLPDEIGLLMMGLSGIRLRSFIVLAYTMNTAGIYVVAVTAQALAR